MNVTVFATDEALHVQAPYHPAFPPQARVLRGKWIAQSGTWMFDRCVESEVRNALVAVYGTDGTPDTVLCDVAFCLHQTTFEILARDYSPRQLFGFGRLLAYRPHYSVPVCLGAGVRVIRGQFPRTGGDEARPSVMSATSPPVILHIKDVPLPLAQREHERLGAKYVAIGSPREMNKQCLS